MTIRQSLLFLAVACSVALSANVVHASLINVDFGTSNSGSYGDATSTAYSGAAVVGTSGDVWNGTTATSGTVSLLGSSGIASGATMTYSGSYMWCCGTGCSFGAGTNTYRNLMNDYLIPGSGTTTDITVSNFVTLTGLAAGTYNLYIYSASDKTNRKATFTAATSVGSNSVVIGPNSSYIDYFAPGVTYGLIQVTVGDTGTLTISVSKLAADGSEIDIDGFQLQSVPEPASIVMLVSGALGVSAYAWRKRHKRNRKGTL
jgi:hypothetical protein